MKAQRGSEKQIAAFRTCFLFFGVFLLLLALCACGSSSGGGEDKLTASAAGRVFDGSGNPMAGATVTILSDAQIVGATDSQGYFVCRGIPPGSHTLTVSRDGVVVLEYCFVAVEGVQFDLGDLYEGLASNCNIPVGCLGDRDCDGLPDDDEAAGWQVSITLGNGGTETRSVASDPDSYDTDRDGLSDSQEFAARIDPTRRDTDGDLLSDYGEMNVYKSHPSMVDTDGDSCAGDPANCQSDPNLWDGYELTLSGTSPTLADTDGDGINDYEEIKVGGTNPRLADLPELRLNLYGNPLIEVQVDYQTGTSAKQQELARDETEQVDTDTTSTKMSVENTITLHTESEIGTSNWPPSFNAKLTTDSKFQHGFFHDTSSSWKKDSVQQSQQNYETWENELISFDDGKVSVALKVTNESNLSFRLKDLRVVAYRMEGAGEFTLIGTMAPDTEEWPETGYTLGPGGEFTMTVKKEHIGAAMMRSLVRNPGAILFEVGAYSLFQLDEWGVNETVNYTVLGEDVVQRTGVVIIDYGDGRVERHMVATNVARNPDGSSRGVSLKTALSDIIGRDYETVASVDGNGQPGSRVLYSMGGMDSYAKCDERSGSYDPGIDCSKFHPRGFWLVGGTSPAFEEGSQVDFDDILLRNGEEVSIVFNNDADGDGIFDREEYLLGTNKTLPDSDFDGLTDYQESKEGWAVAVTGMNPYQVFPDPRFSDIDGDFLADTTEAALGTDPYNKNTDGDEQDDTTDPYPLSPPCLSGVKMGLVAWWSGSGTAPTASDVWTLDAGGVASNGLMAGGNLINNATPGDPMFMFNAGAPDQNDQYIDVANRANDGLSPYREFTVSALVNPLAVATGKPMATILSKGDTAHPTYALSLDATQHVKFTLYRKTYRKCWGWFFGWVDSFCADSTPDQVIELVTTNPLPLQQFSLVTVTFGGETMRIYVDGVLWNEKSTTSTWTSGNLQYNDTTLYLNANTEPLRIGGDYPGTGTPLLPQWPYRGMLDDIQVYGRAFNLDEIEQMTEIGICVP